MLKVMVPLERQLAAALLTLPLMVRGEPMRSSDWVPTEIVVLVLTCTRVCPLLLLGPKLSSRCR